jgi:hypothetical protein
VGALGLEHTVLEDERTYMTHRTDKQENIGKVSSEQSLVAEDFRCH